MLPVSCGGDEELDMDSVVTALREFQQELRDAQRERVFLSSLITLNEPMNTVASLQEGPRFSSGLWPFYVEIACCPRVHVGSLRLPRNRPKT